MTVFLTGSTGFLGRHVLRELLAAGHHVRCLVRSLQKTPCTANTTECVVGDITEPASLKNAVSGCDAIVHLVAIIQEIPSRGVTFEKVNHLGTENLVHAAKAQSVSRFIHVSALGADPQGITPYFRSKGMAELKVRSSGLSYTIFRPSFIFGPGDAVYTTLAKFIKYSPWGIMPVFGAGLYRQMPVSALNVAQGVVGALSVNSAKNKTYDCGGPEMLTYREVLKTIGNMLGKNIHYVPLPLWLSRRVVSILQIMPFSPIDHDRLNMLIRDNVCDPLPFSRELGIKLIPFSQGIQYLKNRN
jgi:uncharacterized protein YbjT (DUF2867 family)